MVIRVEHLYKHYGDVEAVHDFDFEVTKSKCFGFLGPNGAGKTTVMKILYGKAKPDRRDDTLIDVYGFDPRSQELEIKSISAVVPQEDNLDVELNVYQNLLIFSKLYHIGRSEADRRIDSLLEFMELEEKRKAKVRELSGGMKRRLIVARALLNNPSLLILDEPTTGLDPQVRQLIWDRIRTLQARGVTILLTTHYMEEAHQLADEIVIMDRGKRALQGNPSQLLEEEIEPHVLEVTNKSRVTALEPYLSRDSIRQEESDQRIIYYSHDEKLLRQMSGELRPGDFYLRKVNLEDLFLKATGRSIHGNQ
jgi:lipooligosaccharide transport system ATP-binding protein